MKGLKFVPFTMLDFLSTIATADQSKVKPVTANLLTALTDGKSWNFPQIVRQPPQAIRRIAKSSGE